LGDVDADAVDDKPGRLWALIQAWMDTPHDGRIYQQTVADKTGIDKTTMSNIKYCRLFPSPEFLIALSEYIQVSYEAVLNAALEDSGYRGERLSQKRTEVTNAKLAGAFRATKRKRRTA
jgi:transcriptional regulator with XRE-family HTH domain